MDGPDPPEVLSKLAGIKVPWDQDVEYYFFEIENQMEIQGIRSQWLKRCVLANNIPPPHKGRGKGPPQEAQSPGRESHLQGGQAQNSQAIRKKGGGTLPRGQAAHDDGQALSPGQDAGGQAVQVQQRHLLQH